MAFREGVGLVDGPWGYDNEETAREAMERYTARAGAEGGSAKLLGADSLDDLIAEHPDLVTEQQGKLPMRGRRALTRVDRRAKMFTPFGLAPNAPMSDEDVLVLAQQRLRAISLAPSVPTDVREHFRALCDLHVYAAFQYGFNAIAVTMTALAHEFALGVRFVEHYGGRVELVNAKSGETAVLEISLFGQLAQAMAREGSHPAGRGWQLSGYPQFRTSLAGLLHWARESGLFKHWFDDLWPRAYPNVRAVELTRQPLKKWVPSDYDTWGPERQYQWWQDAGRRAWEREHIEALAGMRNSVAHPTLHHIASPVDSIRALDDLAVFLAVLWPHSSVRAERALDDI